MTFPWLGESQCVEFALSVARIHQGAEGRCGTLAYAPVGEKGQARHYSI